jgi:hypothetical protein
LGDILNIDLGPDGHAGVEARIYQRQHGYMIHVLGTDHWRDWLHHILPGARKREWQAADQIIAALVEMGIAKSDDDGWSYIPGDDVVISGHSWGGCIAAMVATILVAPCYIYGGKRSPRKGLTRHYVAQAYRHRGDIVPLLPPWRPRYTDEIVFGKWMWPWEAHKLSNYREVMV